MSILASRAGGLAWIERSHIRFRIAGGRHDGETCINLVVGDEIVRTATGDNSNTLRMETWDVKDLQGKTARLDIIDRRKGSWGFVGHIDDNWYGSSADAAQWVAEHYDRLYRQTELFRRTYHDTTLPYWLAKRVAVAIGGKNVRSAFSQKGRRVQIELPEESVIGTHSQIEITIEMQLNEGEHHGEDKGIPEPGPDRVTSRRRG